jgi:hypothetical protein
MWKSEREGDADLPGGTRHAGIWQVAGVEFTNADEPGVNGGQLALRSLFFVRWNIAGAASVP